MRPNQPYFQRFHFRKGTSCYLSNRCCYSGRSKCVRKGNTFSVTLARENTKLLIYIIFLKMARFWLILKYYEATQTIKIKRIAAPELATSNNNKGLQDHRGRKAKNQCHSTELTPVRTTTRATGHQPVKQR